MNAGDFDTRDLLAQTPVAAVELHEVLGSTNDHARELAGQDVGPLPQLIVARRQTRGRGRGGNRWWSEEGGLTFSLLIQGHVVPSPDVPGALVSPVTALAVADAVQDWVPQHAVQLKWPNDVFLEQRKLCGILIESTLRPTPKTIVGIGLNVNNRLTAASPSLDQAATSLIEILGHPLSLQDVLVSLVRSIFEVYEQLASGCLQVPSRWSPYCLLSGRTVCVRTGRDVVQGVCQGIAASGGLRLATAEGPRICHSGTVERIA